MTDFGDTADTDQRAQAMKAEFVRVLSERGVQFALPAAQVEFAAIVLRSDASYLPALSSLGASAGTSSTLPPFATHLVK